jgi:hypothetical protein
MGLDQYLTARKYVPSMEWPAIGRPETIELGPGITAVGFSIPAGAEPIINPQHKAIVEALNNPPREESSGIYVEFTAIQWRKANQIHRWFVEELEGLENMERKAVDADQLRALRSACETVLDTVTKGQPVEEPWPSGKGVTVTYPNVTLDTAVALENLPPSSGFFFGQGDLDQWYVEDLEFTRDSITKLLDHPSMQGDVEFTYHGWW